MNELMRSPGASFVIGIVGILLPGDSFAQYRVAVEPSVEMTGVHDDNLFFSDDERPASDYIQRVTPTLQLQFESSRWSATTTYAFDADRYANYSTLTNWRARQSASIAIQHRSSPRMVVALDGAYANTDTLADLNLTTGLADARIRVRRLTARPSVQLALSPRLSVRAADFSTDDRLSDGRTMRSHIQTLGIERAMTHRDLLALNYEQGFYAFDSAALQNSTSSFALRAGWTRDLDPSTQFMLEAGPRLTEGRTTPDLVASLTRAWRHSSLAVSGLQTETTVVGHVGTLQTRSVSATYTYTPTQKLSTYATPGVLRSTQRQLEVTVYRVSLGFHYAFTPLMGFQVAYNHDVQRGLLQPLQGDGELSHSTLVVGFTTRWRATAPEQFR